MEETKISHQSIEPSNMLWMLLVLLLGTCVIFELLVTGLVYFLRKDFQWLITSRDDLPQFDRKALKKFISNGFDAELGWIRKPNTSGVESKGSFGAKFGHQGKSSYHIDQFGARKNPNHEHMPRVISTFGDSFVFARQVNDNETWQWHLSELTQTNVQNFGVGNYGLDQAFLRLKREVNFTDVVIMGVVPETIVRILNVWKHYCEYGNTFGFKPRYLLSKTGISLFPNLIDREEKFYSLAKFLPQIRANDYFYKNKFKQDMLKFPYSLAILRHANHHIPLLYSLILRKLYEHFGKQYDEPWNIILKNNRKYCIELYQDDLAVELLLRIVNEFVLYAKLRGFTPVFMFMPYQTDLEYVKANGGRYYEKVYARMAKMLCTIDLTEKLLSVRENVYNNDFYGGHFNALGNRLVAEELFCRICKEESVVKRVEQVLAQ